MYINLLIMTKITTRDLIKMLCAEKGVTIQELAERVGKSRASVSNTIRYNKMNVKNFKEYLQALGTDLNIELPNGAKYTIEM